ncbi:hypothetical protein ACE41I_12565 [Bacillus cereus]
MFTITFRFLFTITFFTIALRFLFAMTFVTLPAFTSTSSKH